MGSKLATRRVIVKYLLDTFVSMYSKPYRLHLHAVWAWPYTWLGLQLITVMVKTLPESITVFIKIHTLGFRVKNRHIDELSRRLQPLLTQIIYFRHVANVDDVHMQAVRKFTSPRDVSQFDIFSTLWWSCWKRVINCLVTRCNYVGGPHLRYYTIIKLNVL